MEVKFEKGPSALNVEEAGRVERGEVVSVSPQLGKKLVEQGWTDVSASSRTSSKKNTNRPRKPTKEDE
jgi:hypothetical protein